LLSTTLHPFSKLRDLPEEYSYFKCQFYVTKTAKNSKRKQTVKRHFKPYLKAMLHGAIFLATCNAILLLRDVKLPNTSLRYTPLMFSQHIENSSLVSLINISQE
jgi:hypothetical protein